VACAKPALRTSSHPTPAQDNYAHALRLTFETASAFSSGWIANDPRFLCLFGTQTSDTTFAIDSLSPSELSGCDGLGVAYITHRRTSFAEELVLMRALAQAKATFAISIAVVGVSSFPHEGKRALLPQFYLVMKLPKTRRVFAQT
jgi:hypothetical protein